MRRARCLLAVLLAASSCVLADDTAPLKAGVFTPPRMAPEFSLQGSDGSELNLAEYRGKVVLLGFGFTSCAEVCPITLATLAQAHKKLGAKASGLQVVYLTVDPDRDDASRMKEYLALFDASFVGGTGTAEQLAKVRTDYGIAAERKEGPDGAFTHSSFVYVIDRQGLLRALMPYGHPPEDYVHDVALLLMTP